MPKESHNDDNRINLRIPFEYSDHEEELEHLRNSKTNILPTTEENDIFGWGDLLARVLSTQEEEEVFMREWGNHF